jgi:hypothetical protein
MMQTAADSQGCECVVLAMIAGPAFIVVLVILTIIVLALLGPAIGNIFSNIVYSL